MSMDFIKELSESRMTRDQNNNRKLTYTDCCERVYLCFLVLESMRNSKKNLEFIKKYSANSLSVNNYQTYYASRSDLHNFLHFIAGPESAQQKLKDPESALKISSQIDVPLRLIKDYLSTLMQRKDPVLNSKFFIKLEQELNITDSNYKSIRRDLTNWDQLTNNSKRSSITKLLFAARAKLRSSDIIDDLEKWVSNRNLEDDQVLDTETVISKPDIVTSIDRISNYRFLTGSKNLMMIKRFLDLAKDGKSVPAYMMSSYLPVIEMIDDIVQSGPDGVQQLKALHKRVNKNQ